MRVRISEKVKNPDNTDLDGAFYAMTSPNGEEDGANGHPLVFDVPNIFG